MNIREEVQRYLSTSGVTLTEVVELINKSLPTDEQTTVQNLSNKLSRGTLRYSEALAIAEVIGMEIQWTKSPLLQFVDDLKYTKDIKTLRYGYSIEKTWDPLVVELNTYQLKAFVLKFGYSGKYKTVEYNLIDNELSLTGIGNDILEML